MRGTEGYDEPKVIKMTRGVIPESSVYYPMQDPNNWVEYGNLFTYYRPESNPFIGNFYRCKLKNKPNWPSDLTIRFNFSKGGFQISRSLNDSMNNKAYYPPILFGDRIPDIPPDTDVTTQVLFFKNSQSPI